ncbi:MAG: hypothetical protein ACYDAO_06035 [Thermoplasmataceae archaeon]
MNAKREIDDLCTVVKDSNSTGILEELSKLISKVAENNTIHDLASRIGSVNATFQALRKAFHLPEKGELSENISNDKISHENDRITHESCNIFMGQLKAILEGGISLHEIDAAKQIMKHMRSGKRICLHRIRKGPYQGQTIHRNSSSGRSGVMCGREQVI